MSKPPSEQSEESQRETREVDDGATDGWTEERARRLDSLLASVETKLGKDEFKASVGDFIRLLQLRKELADENPREITVQWVEPSGEEDAPA